MEKITLACVAFLTTTFAIAGAPVNPINQKVNAIEQIVYPINQPDNPIDQNDVSKLATSVFDCSVATSSITCGNQTYSVTCAACADAETCEQAAAISQILANICANRGLNQMLKYQEEFCP